MKPIQRGELKNTICSAYVKYLDTGETEQLTTKADSNCHFFDPFLIDNHKIILRLDWSDLDADGHPTLDADFYDAETGIKRSLRGARRAAHHTNSTSPESRTYEWVFGEYSRPFKVVVHWIATVKDKLTVKDSMSCEVFRSGVKFDE